MSKDLILIEDPDRELWRLMACKYRLKVMIDVPGGRWRVSPLTVINRMYGTNFRTAKKCLPFVEEKIEERERELRR
jgi:hypothetical protein